MGLATATKVRSKVIAFSGDGKHYEVKSNVMVEILEPGKPMSFGVTKAENTRWFVGIKWKEHAPLLFKAIIEYVDFKESASKTRVFYFYLPADYSTYKSLPYAPKEYIDFIEKMIQTNDVK